MGRNSSFRCPNCARAFLTSKAVNNHLSHPRSPCAGWIEILIAQLSKDGPNRQARKSLLNPDYDTDLDDNPTAENQAYTDQGDRLDGDWTGEEDWGMHMDDRLDMSAEGAYHAVVLFLSLIC